MPFCGDLPHQKTGGRQPNSTIRSESKQMFSGLFLSAAVRTPERKQMRGGCPMSLPTSPPKARTGQSIDAYAPWSRGVFPGGCCIVNFTTVEDHVSLGRRGYRPARRQAEPRHLPPISRPAAGGGPQDAGSSVCTSPQGARPPREIPSHPLSAGSAIILNAYNSTETGCRFQVWPLRSCSRRKGFRARKAS